MLQNKSIALIIVFVIMSIILGCLIYIVLNVEKEEDYNKYVDLHIIYSEEDAISISLSSQISETEKLLIFYFDPICDPCKSEMLTLQSIDMPDLVVDMISSAPQDSIDALLETLTFQNVAEVNVVYDSLLIWRDALEIRSTPTTLYYKNGQLEQKRRGYIRLDKMLYEE